MLSEPIKHNDKNIFPGEKFQPISGDEYTVTYVGIRREGGSEVLVLRDSLGEFTRPIKSVPDHIVLSEN